MTTLIREAGSPSPLAFPSLIPPSRLLYNPTTRSKNRYEDYLPCVVKFTAQTASNVTGHQTITRFELSVSAIESGFKLTPLALNQLVTQPLVRWERVRSPVVWLAV